MAREIDFVFPLPLGLHARPASFLRDAACRFASRIAFVNQRAGLEANARSTLALVATLTRQGDTCTLVIEGDDEQAACDELQRFLGEELPGCDVQAQPPPPAPAGTRPLPRALAAAGGRVLHGTQVSPGIARAPAFVLDSWQECLDVVGQGQGSVAEELEALDRALGRVRAELERRLARAVLEPERAILGAHRSILEDEEWRARIEAEIRLGGVSASRAVLATAEQFASLLRVSGSAYLEERALDIRELAVEVVRALAGGGAPPAPAGLPGPVVCIAPSLGPAQLMALDTGLVKGLVLGQGGTTSHTAILARAFGIPSVSGVAGFEKVLRSGLNVIVDGERGLVLAEPSPAELAFYAAEGRKLEAARARVRAVADAPGATADGRRIEVAANVGSVEEARLAFEHGAEAIGLLRTELFFLGRPTPPNEEEQTRVYTDVALLAAGRGVIVRTLDIGGDKPLPYLGLPVEANPFLGLRAVRMYGTHPEVIRTQVRGILRASATGRLKIMLPMVCCLEEVRAFRALVARLQAELATEGVPFDPGIEVGIMVEIPAVAFLLEQLAPEVDFFSIGSNDLAQYFLAVDRDNPAVAHLYSPYHPAFWRLLRQIVDGAHRHDRWVGICGELGGTLLAAPLLAGLGLDEVSLASPGIPAMKAAIRRCETSACRELLERAVQMGTAAEVESLLRQAAEAGKDRSLCSASLVRLGSEARTREEAIKELVDLLHLAGRVDDPDRFEEAIWQREETVSTGVGFGVAIPHGRSPHVGTDSIAVLTFETGVAWESLDGEPVAMAILIALRDDAGSDAHLRMIAGLARRLMDDEFRKALLEAEDATEIVALLQGVGDMGGR